MLFAHDNPGNRDPVRHRNSDVFVLRASPKFECVATNSIGGEPMNASLAISDGNNFIRTDKQLVHRQRELRALLDLFYKEGTEYQILDVRRDWQKYWDSAQANAKAISEQIDKICEAIRSRLTKFD